MNNRYEQRLHRAEQLYKTLTPREKQAFSLHGLAVYIGDTEVLLTPLAPKAKAKYINSRRAK